MPGIEGIKSNVSAALSDPALWWLARKSVRRHGAIQHVDELTEFAIRVSQLKPRTVLEIGSAQGGVFWLLCRVASDTATLLSLDLPPSRRNSGGEPTAVDLASMKRQDQTVHVIHEDSHGAQALSRVRKCIGDKSLDLLFIDGDHTYAGVRQDYSMYGPLVRRGGMIAFHDIVKTPWEGCEVDRFWRELDENPALETRTIVRRSPSHFGGFGILVKS